MKLIYMGTPEFAVLPLSRLIEAGHNVVAVVTMPDKPVGRHQTQLQASPVKQFAVSKGIPVLQPERLKDEQFLEELRSYEADLQVVVAFRMLPEVVWAMPRLGTFNLHAALLPQYRGAAPINWAIINGDTETGITTFFLDHDIDTGRVIYREAVPIHDTDNVEDVHDRLMKLGAELVLRTVDDIAADRVHPIPQSELETDEPLRPAPKIFKDTCRIDFSRGLKRTYDFIRGLSPYPTAWTELHHAGGVSVLKIFASHKEFLTPAEPVGTVIIEGRKSLKIALADGYLHIDSLQIAGKRRMLTPDFLCGFHADGTESVL